MRKRVRLARCASFAAAMLALRAAAQAPEANASLFRPAAGGDGTAGVEGTAPLAGDVPPIELRLLLDAAQDPVRLSAARVRRRIGAWASFQGRLDRGLSIFAQVPVTLDEAIDLSRLGGPTSAGAGASDVRVGLRTAFGRASGFDFAGHLAISLATSQPQSLTGDGRAGVELLGATSRRADRWELLGNAFLRFRPPRDLGEARIGNEIGLRAAARYDASEAVKPFAELEGSTSLRSLSWTTAPIEVRAGARFCFFGWLAADAAVGTRLDDAAGAPTLRGLASLLYSPSACKARKAAPATSEVLLAEVAQAREKARRDAAAREVADSLAQAEAEAQRHALGAVVAGSTASAEQMAAGRAFGLREEEERDSDGDGIPDVFDNCPFEKGTLLNRGCPATEKQMVAVRDDRIELFQKIYFSSGKATITPASLRLIDQIAALLNTHPKVLKVQIDGHTDSRGNAAFNTRLSRLRAEAVLRAVVARGVERSRLNARGLGSSQPIAPNNTAAGRELNRRVELTIVERRAGDASINPSEVPK
jgi:outer membrane protein OmpA-like peptidoglycan-associated protein